MSPSFLPKFMHTMNIQPSTTNQTSLLDVSQLKLLSFPMAVFIFVAYGIFSTYQLPYHLIVAASSSTLIKYK